MDRLKSEGDPEGCFEKYYIYSKIGLYLYPIVSKNYEEMRC